MNYSSIHVIIFVQQNVGETEVAVPTHMFKFVIAVSESGDGTLITGAFVVRNAEGYGSEEMEEGNEELQKFVDKNVKTSLKTVTKDTGIQFHKMLETGGHKYNEELLNQCGFITPDEFKSDEEKHIRGKIARQQKQKAVIQKSAEKQSKP